MNMRFTLYLAVLFTLLLLFSTCKDKGNPINGDPPNGEKPPCPPNEIVPTQPYDSPIWHPSGQFIGFNHTPLRRIEYPYQEPCYGVQHFAGDSAGFWLINADGSNMRRIFPYKLLSPAWSPDGLWIAFGLPIGDEVHIFKMRFSGATFDTTTVVQLTTEGRNFFSTWSPDGLWLAYDSNSDSPNGMNFIWKMKADGSQKRRIAYEPTQGEIRMPHWSPDGRKIAHIRYLIGTSSSEIFVMDSSGANPLRLTVNSYTDYYPKYSPDGTKIAFWSSGNIWLMDTTGSNQRQLTTRGVDSRSFTWSPDDTQIVYTRYRSDDWTYANGVLWILGVHSGMEKQLTFNP
jgi:Tol biopolymer transport system component